MKVSRGFGFFCKWSMWADGSANKFQISWFGWVHVQVGWKSKGQDFLCFAEFRVVELCHAKMSRVGSC